MKPSFVAWYFLLPLVALHLIVIALPTLFSLALSMTDWRGIGDIGFVGFENYVELFDDRIFLKAIKHNVIWTSLFLTLPVVVALAGAYLLTGIKRGQLFFRLVFFFPYVIASIVNSQIFKYIFHPIHGIGTWFNERGIGLFAASPFTTRDTSLYAVAFVDAWHFWGFLVVIYLTGMYQVDQHLYEAAEVEGATRWQKFIYITLPSIRPVLVFSLMIILIWSVPVFDYVYILTRGGPAYSSEVLANYLYSQAFERFNVGYASSMGVLMCFYVIFIVGLFSLLRKMGWEI